MPFIGLLTTLDQLHIELAQPDREFSGRLWQQRLRLLMRAACYAKLLLVPLVLAIAVRWEALIPPLLALGGLYLATEAFSAFFSRLIALGCTANGKRQAHWSRRELDGFLRSEFVLTGTLLLAGCEPLLHLDTAILLSLLVLVALVQHMLLYGVLVVIVQCGVWGASWQQGPQRQRRLRCGLQWGAPRVLGALQWGLKLVLLLAGGALLLCHLPGIGELLSYLQMELDLYAHQQYWLWPLCLLLGMLAGLWGRWLMTVIGYFTPARLPRQERQGRVI